MKNCIPLAHPTVWPQATTGNTFIVSSISTYLMMYLWRFFLIYLLEILFINFLAFYLMIQLSSITPILLLSSQYRYCFSFLLGRQITPKLVTPGNSDLLFSKVSTFAVWFFGWSYLISLNGLHAAGGLAGGWTFNQSSLVPLHGSHLGFLGGWQSHGSIPGGSIPNSFKMEVTKSLKVQLQKSPASLLPHCISQCKYQGKPAHTLEERKSTPPLDQESGKVSLQKLDRMADIWK